VVYIVKDPLPPSLQCPPSYKLPIMFVTILTCKNLCIRLVPDGGRVQNPYQKGLRYCRRCEVYFKCNDSHCICCGLHLRFTPVHPLAKEKLTTSKEEEKEKK
jgi:hypothetical protein